MFYGFVITERGNNILAHMTAGKQLVMTRVVMEKGTAESAEIARSMTEPIDAGPAGTSTLPVVKGKQVNMIVEYRSDLNGGLKDDFWIGGFAIYAQDPEDPEGEDAMIYYASLGNARQYVRAYEEGTAADVRRYPVSIKVTEGAKAVLMYPAEAWMTAEDVAEFLNGTLKPQLEQSLTALIEAHDTYKGAHNSIEARMQAAEAAMNRIRNDNILDNWYLILAYDGDGNMVLPVNQRGVSGVISTPGYFIDRWILVSGTVELTPEGLKLDGEIQQRLEHSIGMETTASALSTSGPIEAEYDDTEKVFSITAAGETIIAAKLEVGKVQTLARQEDDQWILNDPPPDPVLELVKCQRYQFVLTTSIDGSYMGVGAAVYNTNSGISARIMIPTPTELRNLPTMTVNGTWRIGGDSDVNQATRLDIYSISTTGVFVRAFVSKNLTPGYGYFLIGGQDSMIIFDANL